MSHVEEIAGFNIVSYGSIWENSCHAFYYNVTGSGLQALYIFIISFQIKVCEVSTEVILIGNRTFISMGYFIVDFDIIVNFDIDLLGKLGWALS